MDCSTVGGPGSADSLLHRDTQLFRKIQCITLIAGIGDHAGVNMAQHGAALNGRLDHIGLYTGIVCWAALKHDGDIGANHLTRHGGTTHADLFLGGAGAEDVHRQLLALQFMHRLKDCGAAQAAVEALTYHQVVFLRIGEGHIGNHRLADPNPIDLNGLFSGDGAYVYLVVSVTVPVVLLVVVVVVEPSSFFSVLEVVLEEPPEEGR